MFKDNGRLAPASKEELAGVARGKFMECPKCKRSFVIVKAQFADMFCDNCGERLLENSISFANKTTGRYNQEA